MARLIKRYESRKLYDTEESQYASLEEIADWVRQGQEVEVVDNATGEDVTAQTLSQIILEEGRSGRSRLPSELLHQLIRRGGDALVTRVQQVQDGMDRIVQVSFDRLSPVREAREEMTRLRSRLEELESSLVELERERHSEPETSGATATEPAAPASTQASRAASTKASTKATTKASTKTSTRPTTRRPSQKSTTRKTAPGGRSGKAPRG